MSLYLKTFSGIDIDTLTAFHINQLKSPQSLYLHIFVFFQRFFYQLEKFLHKTISILLAHAMLFSQQVNQVLYV